MRPLRHLASILLGSLTGLALLATLVVPASGALGSQGKEPVVSLASASQGQPAASVGQIRPAANLALFNPGNIISDAAFFNSATMTESQIDAFFRSKVPTCQTAPGFVCLKDYQGMTTSRSADAYCDGYQGGGSESAARIVFKTARSCGINPQVLIVMLQKEQGLVTHTRPDARRYGAAMGQACPDTAACDPRFAGFFNQVYGAARQMQIYAEGRHFTWYAPGKTWNILYSDDHSCGSSPVYIENIATSALYYYTPYQPNRASLDAGYAASSDRCASYGNRNFFQYFSDWFGGPTGPYLLRSTSSEPIYLVDEQKKYHVQSVDDLATFTSRFGAFRFASQSMVDQLVSAGPVTRAVRDPRTSVISLLEPDGSKHRFATVESMALFGYPTTAASDMSPSVLDAFKAGAEVGDVFRRADAPEVFVFADGTRRHVYDQIALAPLLKAGATYVATISPEAIELLAHAPTYFGAGRLVRGTTHPEVYLTTPTTTLVHVPTLALAARFGATKLTVVDDKSIMPNAIAGDGLLPAVRCGEELRIVDGGGFRKLDETSNVRSTVLSTADCAAFPTPQTEALRAPIFVSAPGTPDLYALEKSAIRHVWSYSDILTIAAGRPVTTVSWPADVREVYGIGTPLKAIDGTFVRFGARPEVYRVDSSSVLHHVATAKTLQTIGGASPAITTRPDAQLAAFTVGTALLDAGSFIRFASGDDVYTMQGDSLRHVANWKTLIALGAGEVPHIESVTGSNRGSFATGAPLLANGLFVRFYGAEAVYYVESEQLRHIESVATLTRLGDGTTPTIDTLPKDTFRSYSIGAPIP